MVSSERKQDLVDQDNMLKVVDDALSIEEVHGGGEPVPVQALGRAQGPGAAWNVGDGDDFFERDDLNSGDDANHVDMAHEKRKEKDGYHDKGPDRSSPEVGPFLLVLGLLLFSGGWLL